MNEWGMQWPIAKYLCASVRNTQVNSCVQLNLVFQSTLNASKRILILPSQFVLQAQFFLISMLIALFSMAA